MCGPSKVLRRSILSGDISISVADAGVGAGTWFIAHKEPDCLLVTAAAPNGWRRWPCVFYCTMSQVGSGREYKHRVQNRCILRGEAYHIISDINISVSLIRTNPSTLSAQVFINLCRNQQTTMCAGSLDRDRQPRTSCPTRL